MARTPASSSSSSSHGACAHSGSQKPPDQLPERARCAAIPVASCSRTPPCVASSGSTAWVAADVQVACAASRAGRSRRPSAPAACAYAAAECSSAAASPRSRAAARSSRCDSGRISRRNAGAALQRAGRLELVAQHRGDRERHPAGRLVERVEQRQVAGRDRLPEPLLAERPRPEALHVRHVGVQDDRQRARRRAHGAQRCQQVQRAVERAAPEAEVALRDRRREAVVERPA